VNIVDAGLFQLFGKWLAAEMRMATTYRKATDVHQALDSERRQYLDKLIHGTTAMTDGVNQRAAHLASTLVL
jgi:hypothetical protein